MNRSTTPLAVKLVGGDSARIDFFGNPLFVRHDGRGGILLLDGSRTTLKVRVERVAATDVEALGRIWSLREQEAIFGRSKGEGAPLSGGTEFTEPDFGRQGRAGEPLIAEQAHVRLAHPSSHGGARILRRGYNFTDGNDALGRLDAGLFFVAFERDPRTGFIPLQQALARHDVLNEYIVHTGSGVYAIPAGVPAINPDGSLVDDAFLGAALFA
jgi:deferrochelatase/peroxidase EfeB